MLKLLTMNLTTIIILLIVAVIVTLAIIKIVRDKKRGIGPCGQKCCECPHAVDCGHKR